MNSLDCAADMYAAPVTMFIILLVGCANVIAVVQVANLSLEAEPEDT